MRARFTTLGRTVARNPPKADAPASPGRAIDRVKDAYVGFTLTSGRFNLPPGTDARHEMVELRGELVVHAIPPDAGTRIGLDLQHEGSWYVYAGSIRTRRFSVSAVHVLPR